MLYLSALIFFLVTYAEAQSIVHDQISKVKRGDGQATARITCRVTNSQYVHWYMQKPNKGLKRILYMRGDKDIHEDGFTKAKYEASKTSNKYALNIYKVTNEDEGTYYCAAWYYRSTLIQSHRKSKQIVKELTYEKQVNRCCSYVKDFVKENCTVFGKVFGRGTQLFITDQTARKPDVTILATSKEVAKDIGSVTLLCSLQNFFPNAISVKWTEKNTELGSEKGEIIKNASTNMYSLYSWITIKNPDIGKIYKCSYKHEGNVKPWEEIEYDTKILKDTIQVETKIENCTNSPGDDDARHMIIRAAQLTYSLLLLKCLLYCPLLLVFKYKFPK
ncbi:immunoglobulin gamma-1 heavy chain-like [Hyla sarda]|uniref:immunoglobulin gamma-1 heavy chain-like n=1 Tax=Hyla sarda TaxID=327740 RepID=UPI0024C329A0|nr:immunoglobulin gamma-1 heavy chain-like [Hyla sarda]